MMLSAQLIARSTGQSKLEDELKELYALIQNLSVISNENVQQIRRLRSELREIDDSLELTFLIA